MEHNSTGVILASELPQSRINFSKHYYLFSGGVPIPLNQYISFPFYELKSLVSHLLTLKITPAGGGCVITISEEELAFRFIHRFNVNTNQWFSCIEVCKMTIPVSAPTLPHTFPITIFPALKFDIIDDHLRYSSSLPSNLDHDPDYFANVIFDSTGFGDRQPLDTLQHVKSITIPWKREIRRLAEHNFCYDSPTAYLTIENRSKEREDDQASIDWPHTIALYMWDGSDLLGTPNPNLGEFNMSAADVGGLCPPNCSNYTMPGLPSIILMTI